ncbi:MAG: hypothetical protein IKT67_10400 [Lachnospiraceae bacterium]|nr:hypothetical protein [Lachnospiraceae bacterium]
MLMRKEIIDIANNYAQKNQTNFYSLQLLFVTKSKFVEGYWDISFKVLDEQGYEIDGPLLLVVDGENGQTYLMEEFVMMQSGKNDIKISNKPIR